MISIATITRLVARLAADKSSLGARDGAAPLYALEGLFFAGALKKNTLKALEPYYNAIRTTAHQITTHIVTGY
jgi:hypothetical protein